MKRVLFIAYHFPPLAGGGTFRSLKFVKYLPEFGWLPTVLTTNTKNYWAYDESLLDEIPKKVNIIRASEFDPFYLQILLSKVGLGKLYQKIKDRFFIPDEKIGWIPLAYRKAVKELKRQKYDLIFSTSPTPCAHIIAMKLKKRFEIPWICDTRDFWTTHFTYQYKNTKREIFERSIEKSFFIHSNHVTTVSSGVKLEFLKRRCRVLISVITNGYDTEKPVILSSQSKFKILYTGSFYGHYNPSTFLNVLLHTIWQNPEMQSSLNVCFIGNYSQDIISIFKQFNQSINITIKPFKSSSELEEEFLSASILLMILPEEEHYQAYLPAKLFSYIAVHLPIFAIIPDGEAKEILKKSKLGFFADPSSPEDIKNQILNLYHLWQNNQLHMQANQDYINQFHRRTLTKKLADIFEEVA